MKKQHVMGILAAMLLISACLLIYRGLFPPPPPVSDEQQSLIERSGINIYGDRNLPPKGDMTDEQYLLYLARLREEAAAASAGEPKDARKASGTD